jgi:hypothetical protein
MGGQVVLDLISSFVVFGWLLLMTLRGNTANNENYQTLKGDCLVQQNLVAFTKLLEYDFRKIGFCKEPNNIPDPTVAIILADTNKIKFLTDVDFGSGPDGVVDTLYYYIGPTSELSMTPNPRDRLIYRVVNHDVAKGTALGLTTFSLKYYDDQGIQIPTPVSAANLSQIQIIQISICIENVYAGAISETAPLNTQYASAFWQQMRLSTRNYKVR